MLREKCHFCNLQNRQLFVILVIWWICLSFFWSFVGAIVSEIWKISKIIRYMTNKMTGQN